MTKIVGIDLGTTRSAVAAFKHGEPEIIENSEGERVTPSVVAFDDGERLVGKPARNQLLTNQENTVKSIKRHMGEDYSVELEGDNYTPQEISAMILQKLKTDAEDKLGEDVSKAVITVPAHFDDTQRQATKDAGEIAGLDVERILNEPTAASLAYGLDDDQEKTILVYDFGGGTFDVTVLEIGDGIYEVQATEGSNDLGGDDFDQRIVDWVLEQFKEEHGIDLAEEGNDEAMQRIREKAEEVKKELSSRKQAQINIPFIHQQDGETYNVDYELTRSQFEDLVSDLIERTAKPTKKALNDADVSTNELHEVILVGGTTRIPAVREQVRDITGMEPDKSVSPDEAVALGASIQAGSISGEADDLLLLDVAPLSLGVETKGGIMTKLIEKNTTVPAEETKTFTTAQANQSIVTVNVLQGEREMAHDNKSLGQFNLEGIPPAPAGQPQIEVTFEIDADGILHVSAVEQNSGKDASITIEDQARLDDDEIERMKEEAEKHAEEDQKKREFIEAKNKADQVISQAEDQLDEYGDQVDDDIVTRVEDGIENLRDVRNEAEEADEIEAAIEKLNEELQEIGKEMYGDQAGPGAAGPGGMGAVDPSNMSEEDLKKAAENMGVDPSKVNLDQGDDDVVDADYEEVDDDE